MRRRDRKLLSPVLSDQPLVGEHLTRRLRIVLIAMLVAFFLTNLTSYLIGQAVRAEADRDTRTRVDGVERKVTEDIEARAVQRDAERKRMEETNAAQQRELAQLRRDLCVALDRVTPRDQVVVQARRQYGCTGGVAPAASRPAPAAGQPSQGAGASGGAPSGGGTEGAAPSAPRPPTAPPGPAGPSGPPGPSSPTTSPPAQTDDGLICLPVVGCVL